jgi:hypothetical protein
MPLQSSGEININQIRTEMVFNSGSNTSATHPTTTLSNNISDSNYIASASSNGGNAYLSFDNSGNRWVSSGTYSGIDYVGGVTTSVDGVSIAGEWIQLEFINGVTNISSVVYSGTGLQANFGKIVVCASNNQSTFTKLTEAGHGYVEGTYNISSTKSYRYIRTICLQKFQGGNNFCTINEWKVNGIIGNGGQIDFSGFQGLTGGAISFNDFFGKENIMRFNNWYNLFTRINSNFTIAQSGSNPDVQLQLNSTATGGSMTTLYYSQAIQNYSKFIAEFEIYTGGSGDGSSFNVGYNSTGAMSEGPNTPGFTITFQLYTGGGRSQGIYLWNNSGTQVGFYGYGIGESVWRKVSIIYNRSTTNTWQIFFNGTNVINYSNPGNESWVTSSAGSYFGFGSRTGGATHNFYVRRFTLSVQN